MTFWHEPFFWAFLAMIGWYLGLLVVGSHSLGGSRLFGIFVVALAEIPRFALPLPFVDQPRFATGPPIVAFGLLWLAIALLFGSAALGIDPFTRPSREKVLRTDGLYSVVRHPVMLCDSLWPAGWALLFGSIVGVVLTVVWLPVAALLTVLEEERLIEEYGQTYLSYRRRTPRIIPFLRWP